MHIDQLELFNFRGIKNQSFCFHGKNAVFFGINGAGKSSILHSICLLFLPLLRTLTADRSKLSANLNVDDISFGASESRIAMRYALGESSGTFSRSIRKGAPRLVNRTSVNSFGDAFKREFLQDEMQNMPIFVNYGVHRLVIDIPLRIRQKHNFDKLAALENAIHTRIDFRTFFEWFRAQEDLENEMRLSGDLEYRDRSLNAVRKAISNLLDHAENLRIQRHPLAMKIDKRDTHGNIRSLAVHQLSDGEKCSLALLGDLSRRLSLANPSLENPNEGRGVVLIDELELHMHPAWQRKIIAVLKKTFPHVQFILSTHSPQVLGELDDSFCIYRLDNRDGELSVQAFDRLDGRDSNCILEDLMDTGHLNRQTQELYRKFFSFLATQDFGQAQKLLQSLQSRSGENDPRYVEAYTAMQLERLSHDIHPEKE